MKGTSTRLIAFATSVCLSTPLLTVNLSASAADTLYTAENTADIPVYTSPSTEWNFDSYTLTSEKRDNIPYLTGNAAVESNEVKFPADSTASGGLELDFGKPIKKDTVIEFDITPHSKHLGTQYISYSIQNSEEEEILGFQVHPYDTSAEVKGISVCGTTIADGKSVCKNLSAGSVAHIKNDIDYTAGKITVTVGDGIFTADIPASAATDIASFNFSVKRSKNAADRYISLDNLTVSEYTSENPPAETDNTVTDGFIESEFNSIPCRINAPTDYSETAYPLVVYLHSESRSGTNNFSQLYNSQYIFNKLKGKAVLIAPQAEESFKADSMTQFIETAAEEYNTSSATVIGQSESGSVCYELAANGTADKIAVLSCGAEITAENAQAVKDNGTAVWNFGGYNDSKISLSSARSASAMLQSYGVDVTYTEYPYSGHNIAENAAEEIGFSDWCISNSPTDKVVDLVLFSGQSNMAGRGTYSESTVCPPGQGYEFHSVTSPSILTTVQEPFGKYENNNTINDSGSNGVDRRSGDMVSSLMKAYYAKTGVPMVGVQASRGGTNTKWWKQSAQYTEATDRYNSAYQYLTDAGYTVRRKLLVWCQGEADADSGVSADTYKSNTLSIFDTLKNATGITDVFIVQTGHYNVYVNGDTPSDSAYTLDSRYFNINQAQKELAENNENIHTVASFYTDYALANMRDAYHFYQPVYNSVGETAGINIAAAYDSSIGKAEFTQSESPVTPPPTETPSETPSESPTPTPNNGLNWDFSTDQTAASGYNVPIISGTASYDSENKNIKFDANDKSSGELKVSLSPVLNGVVTIDFDARITSLGKQYLNYNIYDSNNNPVVSFNFDAYNSNGSLSICGEKVAENGNIKVNKGAKDGMEVTPTHFTTEIHYPKGTVTVKIATSESSYVTFSGTIPQNYKKDVSVLSISKTSSKTANRSMYIDNLSISSYTPNTEMYVTGAASITKRMGMNVTEQYTLSKTYTDNSETVRWSAEGAEGVTIDENTGLLTVSENAAVGKVTITATLVKGNTLPTGTTAQTTVEILPFAEMSEYKLGGSSTIEIGKSSKLSLLSVTDTADNDITEFAELSDFASKDSKIASVSADGTITAHKSGVTDITFNINISKLGTTVPITYTVKTGIYEITSSDTDIDVSNLISYGTEVYRIYKPDGSYETATAVGGAVKNTTGGTVTVVPQYRFEFTSTAAPTDSLISGYVKATSEYSPEVGYGLLGDLNYNINENGCSPLSGKPIKVNLPYGNYDISVYRKGGTRADVYNDDIQIINNTTSYGSDNRPSSYGIMDAPQMLISDGTADITFGHTSGSNERIAAVTFARVPDKYKKQIIWISGDSESANYYPINADGDDLESNKIMMTGFGMQLGKFLDSTKYGIADFGQPSATVKTWYDECFESVNYRMSKGDVIIICFGINEAVSNSNKLSADEMKLYMSRIISAAKAKGVTPILVSPVYSNKYQSKSLFTYSTATDSNDMYSFADEVGVSCIDINKGTQLYISDAVAETGNSNWAKLNYHVNDNLHLSQHSAVMVAAMIAGGMNKLGYSTTDFAHTYKDIADVITDSDSDYTSRGTETGTERVYSIKSLDKYVTLNSAAVTETYPVTVTYDNGKLILTCSDKSIDGGTLVKMDIITTFSPH